MYCLILTTNNPNLQWGNFIYHHRGCISIETNLILQLNHLWDPVILLGVVECDTLPLQVGDGLVLPPGRGVARAPQKHVVGGGGGPLGAQLTALTTFVRYFGHLQEKSREIRLKKPICFVFGYNIVKKVNFCKVRNISLKIQVTMILKLV